MSLTTPNQPTADVPTWVAHDGRRLRAVSFESEVGVDIETAWRELAGNYVDVSEIHAPITASYVVPGEPEQGPGAARHCDIDFNGREVAIKERIIDWIDLPDHKEYTYDVYESVGFPARVYNTWSLRRIGEDRVALRNVFYYRMRPAVMTRPMLGQIRRAARNGVLGYKHFLETGERKVAPSEIVQRYAA